MGLSRERLCTGCPNYPAVTACMVHSQYKYSDFISDRTGGPQISGQYSQFVTAKNISSSRRQFWIPTPIARHGNDVANLPVPSQGSEPMWPQKAPNQHWRWESVWHNPKFSTRIYCILCDIMYGHLRSIPPVTNQRFYRRSNLLRIILFLRRQCRYFCETLT